MISTTMRLLRHRLRRWLEDVPDKTPSAMIPFDNRYDWLGQAFMAIRQDPIAARRPAYLWGILQGAALAKVLGYERLSVVEFGVAGGAGLLSMEHTAEATERLLGISVEVYGFDTGVGIPKSMDYRDCPNIWMDGQFPMDEPKLRGQLHRAKLMLGPVKETVPEFISTNYAPIAFVSFDMDLYSATQSALQVFEANFDRLLPRVVCYFDDIVGLTYSDFNGERLAISEFNARHDRRKISPQYGLRDLLPFDPGRGWPWPDMTYLAHFFDHPRYSDPDELRKPMLMEVGNAVSGWIETK